MNYVLMDTSYIVFWVSICVRNMSVKNFALVAFLSYMESL